LSLPCYGAAWDLGFLAWGAIMLVGGLALMRKGDRETWRETAGATLRTGVQGFVTSDVTENPSN
jgi:hypothetical protein